MLKLLGMGGTFDHLHDGHKYILDTAFSLGQEVHIGLTTEKMFSRKKLAEKIEDYKTRKKNLEAYISTIADLTQVKIFELEDPYGPPISDPTYDGIIASQETYNGALKINEIREEKGFPPLVIIVIPMLMKNDGIRFSSTAIRENLE